MAGKIVADTLEHSTAGSIATNYVVEGSAKAWVNFNGTGTIASRVSLNLSSLTDVSAGRHIVAITNSMSSSDYIQFVHSDVDDAANTARTYNNEVYDRATSGAGVQSFSNSTNEDHAYFMVMFMGDLA